MEALNEQRCPLARLVQKQALEPELVRVQALRVQALVRVHLEPLVQLELLAQEQAQLEPLVQLELLTQEQVQLKLEQRRQRSCPKLQLHRHRCKVPDRSREPQ